VAGFTVNTAEDTADFVVEVAKDTAVAVVNGITTLGNAMDGEDLKHNYIFIFHNFPRDYAKIST
jgi:hypothetical protein